jgi:hypothetical protein
MKKKKVFLGGTCNDSKWRDKLIEKLEIDYFNPVVDDWTEDDYKEELKQRKECDYCLYVITPKMKGTYSIAEVVDDSNKRPEKTLFSFLKTDGDEKFDSEQTKSLDKVGIMIKENGGKYLKTLDEISVYLNFKGKEIK